jgi:ATP-dependent DNA helicase RecG
MIMRIFKELSLVEQWGNGIPKIFEEITKFGLSMPKMEEIAGRVKTIVEVDVVGVNVTNDVTNVGISEENVTNVGVNVTNNVTNVGVSEENVGVNVTNDVTNRIEEIFNLIVENNQITASKIAEVLAVTKRTVLRDIEKLKELGLIERIGSRKFGEWKILKEMGRYFKKS